MVSSKFISIKKQHSTKKTRDLTGCSVQVIPEGYQKFNKSLTVNSRSIRRFNQLRMYTNKPLFIDPTVTREAFCSAFETIHTTSLIVCSDEIEDLVYERCTVLEADILPYEHAYIFIEGEESWSNEQFLVLEKPTTFVIKGQLTIEDDVEEAILTEKISSIDLYGQIITANARAKGILQKALRVKNGTIVTGKQHEGKFHKNVAHLVL